MSAAHHKPRTIVVAIDNSKFAEWAFNFAISIMNIETDKIVLLGVAERLNTAVYGPAFTSGHYLETAQQNIEFQTKSTLIPFGRRCKDMGLKNYSMIMTTSNHAGESIVSYCSEVHADMVVLGRRGIGAVKRVFVGSTSKHVVEHSPCHVVVVKGPEEKHDDEIKHEHTVHTIDNDAEMPTAPVAAAKEK
eukprot:CAMPEP_0177669206 /NCGR_PEP_ID=MMETSP0447-20121125/23296_1 /TAXON_ID=0 /ORGANISM="Stygamoeba regulata, Strain BSH-02190019" /LENGTH=189 /DNA_ID=CAMNT_0019176015 /DNA_START=16 /DNA_END=583 /DNA_ORIENTATION=-